MDYIQIESIKAAEYYLKIQRGELPSTVRYNYKLTLNYLWSKVCPSELY